MTNDFEYWCTIVPEADAENIIETMRETAEEGWELISASMHRTEVKRGAKE